MEPIDALMARVLAVAGSLGFPVDVDRPFDPRQKDLPRVAVWTGPERSVPQDGAPQGWAEEVDVSPVMEVLLKDDVPAEVAAQVKACWRTLRAAVRAEDWTAVTTPGSQPRYEKTALQVEDKPGVSGFAVILDFRVFVD